MSNELQSMKYLSPEYLGQVQAGLGESAGVNGNSVGGDANIGATLPVAALAEPADQPAFGVWTGTLEVVSWFITIMGGYGVLSSLWGIWSLAYLQTNLEYVTSMAQRAPALKGTQLALEGQLEFQSLLMVCIIFKLIVSIGFVAGSNMLKRGVENANMFIVMVCSMAILYGLTSTVVGIVSMPDMSRLPQMNAELASAAASIAIVFSAVGFLFKAAIHGGLIGYMLTRNCKLLFGPKQLLTA